MNDELVSKTVRNLREALKESQQAFANRMGTAVRTIARYEAKHPPKGRALAELERIAAENGLDKFAAIFRNALAQELGLPTPMPSRGANKVEPVIDISTDEERRTVAALLICLRRPEYQKDRAAVMRALKYAFEALDTKVAGFQFILDTMAAVGRMALEGRDPDEIAAATHIPVDKLEPILAVYDPRTSGVRTTDAQQIMLAAFLSACVLPSNAQSALPSSKVPSFAKKAFEDLLVYAQGGQHK